MNIKSLLKSNRLLNNLYLLLTNKKASSLLSKRDTWERLQSQNLANLLNYAKKHSRYFWMHIGEQEVTPSVAVEVLKTLPLLTKDIIREQGYNIYSDEIKKGWHIWGNTGGSTGEPLKFPRKNSDPWLEPVSQWISYSYLNNWGGVKNDDIIVSISGNRLNQSQIDKKVFYSIGGNFPWGMYRFSTLYMNEENLPFYIEQLNKTNASFIRGYSAGVLTLAQYIKEHNIPLNIHLKGIYMTSEAFAESSRKFISDVFNCPVIGQYGHTEMSVFAYQHINDSMYECLPFYGYTEILDEKGRQVEKGEVGEIVVTGFSQIGLPFIRYKTGDLALYKGTNKGVVLIDAIQGRTVDYLYDKEGKKVFLTGAIFGGHIKAFNYISQWQLVQNEIGKISVDIIKGSGYNKEIEKEIIKFFDGFNIEAIPYYVSFIKKQNNGKQKFLIQNIQ